MIDKSLNTVNKVSNVLVMAHRGSRVECVENTKEAFLKAMNDGIKYIELDVTLTKDNEVVIFHDLDLNRLAGIDKLLIDMTLDELKNVVVFNEEKSFFGHIITLKDLVKILNEDMILNVEIKPPLGSEVLLADKTEEILKEYPRHTVSSLKKDSIFEVKKINPKRKTGYIMAVNFECYDDICYADFFSIEDSIVTKGGVEKIHSYGKKVYVWTVNDMMSVDVLCSSGVDGIITNYPKKTKVHLGN